MLANDLDIYKSNNLNWTAFLCIFNLFDSRSPVPGTPYPGVQCRHTMHTMLWKRKPRFYILHPPAPDPHLPPGHTPAFARQERPLTQQ